MQQDLPVVVIGAGPTGLAAASELDRRGLPVLVLERGDEAATSVREWAHVRLFSPWRDLTAPAATALLEARGWQPPSEDIHPTGAEWVRDYLAPLAAELAPVIRYRARVVGVSREGLDRVVDADRAERPFTLRLRTAASLEERIHARAVIDASGTWTTPNPLGADGLPASGEQSAPERIGNRIPDLAQPDVRRRFSGGTTAVVGRGHSALTALVTLSELATETPGTRILWVLRRSSIGDAFGGGDDDQLAARGALGMRARAAVDAGHVRVVTGFRTAEVRTTPRGLVLVGTDAQELEPVHQILNLTGFRPDLSWLNELRLGLDPALQAPVQLAPLIDPNVHSCGTVYPHGAAELAHPEPGFYLAGMKSYGRAPTFLALTGYEQVRSIAAELAGDRASAARVELTLPETGVCSGSGIADQPQADTASPAAGGSCGTGCDPSPETQPLAGSTPPRNR
ncbi:FAD-dependent oxidoreductase [Lipingzhangella sp. LS1_29]|uniref:FAD-dependent oxidoreductase n=1 Tax=Lipingzhangella rawalii TaxID=2055835 RepID=A0ABU2HAH7_9ACTN|nr:FAD-dependent oxidoreductase [Lipingzhangella rawalii]MDS1271594.1 FAD-dependent oxidoreductase [Lipingzhangella rawalii]